MADQQFAQVADLNLMGLPANALAGMSPDALNAMLRRASSMLAGRMTPKWEPPFVSWGDDLTGYTCDVAAWLLLTRVRGVDPEKPEMKNFYAAYVDALKWADDVGAGTIIPINLVDSTSDEDDGSPDVTSQPVMGWQQTNGDGTESEFD